MILTASSSAILWICLAVWFCIAIGSLIIEIETFELVSIWFLIGAIAALITTPIAPKNTVGIIIQLVVFIVVSIVSLLAFRPLCKKKLTANLEKSKDINSMVGLIGTSLTNINSVEGMVMINDTRWSAISNKEIQEGKKIKIVEQNNLVLLVEEILEDNK